MLKILFSSALTVQVKFIYYYLFVLYIYARKPLKVLIPTDMERDKTNMPNEKLFLLIRLIVIRFRQI